MTKKIYEKPGMQVFEVRPAEIVAASGPLKSDGAEFDKYEDGSFSW